MVEQNPIQKPDVIISSQSVVLERMAQAGPEDIRVALVAEGGYCDGYDDRAEQFEASKHTLTPDEAERQGKKLDREYEQYQGTVFALEAWETHLGRGDTTDTFEEYVAKMAEELANNAGKGIEQAKEPAVMFGRAESWNRNNLRKVMGEHFQRQDSGESVSTSPEQAAESTEAERQAQAVREEQETQRRQAQQAAEAARRETATGEARTSMESVRERSELTQTLVKLGKHNTYVHANHKRGFTNTLGDIPSDETKKIYNFTDNVKKIFGTDRSPSDGWRNAKAESVLFMPVVEQEFRTETRTELVERKRFGKDVTRETSHKVAVPGSEHQKMLLNPETGQQEPAVMFRYDFDGTAFASGGQEIVYQEYSGGRAGGALQVAVELPQSVADKLLAQIKERPAYAREVAEALIMNNSNGQIEPADWVEKEVGSGVAGMKPPYKKLQELAPDWKLAIALPKPGVTMAELASTQVAKSMEVTEHNIS